MLGLKKRLRAGSWPGYEIAKDSTTRPREINIGDAASCQKKVAHITRVRTRTVKSPVRVLHG